MSFDVGRAIAQLERREHLRFADECGAWVIRRSRIRREQSVSEAEPRHADALSCFHGVSYTMPCVKCKRSKDDADSNLAKLKLKLSIT
jgi:hypothetical protein